MSLKDRAEATAKNIEGKVQEAVGNLTGNTKAKAEGREKQAEARVRHTVEDVKDEAKKIIDQSFSTQAPSLKTEIGAVRNLTFECVTFVQPRRSEARNF